MVSAGVRFDDPHGSLPIQDILQSLPLFFKHCPGHYVEFLHIFLPLQPLCTKLRGSFGTPCILSALGWFRGFWRLSLPLPSKAQVPRLLWVPDEIRGAPLCPQHFLLGTLSHRVISVCNSITGALALLKQLLQIKLSPGP